MWGGGADPARLRASKRSGMILQPVGYRYPANQHVSESHGKTGAQTHQQFVCQPCDTFPLGREQTQRGWPPKLTREREGTAGITQCAGFSGFGAGYRYSRGSSETV